MYVCMYTVLLKDKVTSAHNFIAIYKCVWSLSKYQACILSRFSSPVNKNEHSQRK